MKRNYKPLIMSMISLCVGITSGLYTSECARAKEEPQVIIETEYVDVYHDYDIYKVCWEVYGVPTTLIKAIEIVETGWDGNKTGTAITHNNTGGSMYQGKPIYFDNYDESTLYVAKNLRENYLDQGLYDIESIGAKYCPEDTKWAQKVSNVIEELLDLEKGENND